MFVFVLVLLSVFELVLVSALVFFLRFFAVSASPCAGFAVCV